MQEKKKFIEQDYFEDPIIDNIKKNIIDDIDFFSYESHSIQEHVASHYTAHNIANESSPECTGKKTN